MISLTISMEMCDRFIRTNRKSTNRNRIGYNRILVPSLLSLSNFPNNSPFYKLT